MAITNYTASQVLNAMCGKAQNATLASSAYLALSKTEPTAASGNVTEPSAASYHRKCIGIYGQAGTQLMGTPSAGVITNSQEIHFDEAEEAWATQEAPLTYACLFSAASGGNLLAYGLLGKTVEGVWTAQSIVPVANTAVIIKAGDLKISLT